MKKYLALIVLSIFFAAYTCHWQFGVVSANNNKLSHELFQDSQQLSQNITVGSIQQPLDPRFIAAAKPARELLTRDGNGVPPDFFSMNGLERRRWFAVNKDKITGMPTSLYEDAQLKESNWLKRCIYLKKAN